MQTVKCFSLSRIKAERWALHNVSCRQALKVGTGASEETAQQDGTRRMKARKRLSFLVSSHPIAQLLPKMISAEYSGLVLTLTSDISVLADNAAHAFP